jgi:hypothetical protein
VSKLTKKLKREARIQARLAGHIGGRQSRKAVKYTGEPVPRSHRPRLECCMSAGDLVRATKALHDYRGMHATAAIPMGALGIVTDEKSHSSGMAVVMFGCQLAEVKFKLLRPV